MKKRNAKRVISERCVAIIPARGDSKAIPKKNIIDFCGRPIIAWTIEQALRSNYIDEVYVSTNDKKISEVSEKYGAKVIRRPDSISTNKSSSEEALLHAIGEIEKHKKIDIVVFLQATSPIRDGEDIDKAIETLLQEDTDSLFSAVMLDSFSIWEIQDNKLKSVTYDYKKRQMRQDRKPYYRENGSIYIFRIDVIKRYNNRLGGKMAVYLMPLSRSYEVDEPEDIKICEYFMKEMLSKEAKIDAKNIQLIVYDFDGVMTDNKVSVTRDGKESVLCNRGDGLAIQMIKKFNIPQLILSTEKNPVVKTRAEKLDVEVIHSVSDKKAVLTDYCKKKNYDLKRVLYIGNDINDLEIMKSVGYPVAPQDANDRVKDTAKVIVKKNGGEGVIREFFENILNL